MRHLLVVLALLAFGITDSQAQGTKTRILFILDASGSMEGRWSGNSKFSIARNLLFQAIDSIETYYTNVEFGMRVFGHQSHRSLKDCEDSKLEVGFGKNNAAAVMRSLEKVKRQGHTPIAYSLFQGANDFPFEPGVRNVLVLITDGIETCEGDPCAIAGILEQKQIVLRPFVIGLGINEDQKETFDCVGEFYDASDESSFRNALNIVISQAMNTTTAQVNLLDILGNPTETSVPLTFYDAHSGEVYANYVHSFDGYGNPDTIALSPVGTYNMTVHTTPSVEVKGITLTPGKHNIIAADAPQGTLALRIQGGFGLSSIMCVVRQHGDSSILTVMPFNSSRKLLVGTYDLEVLSLPPQRFDSVLVTQSGETKVDIPQTGTVQLSFSRSGRASIIQYVPHGVEKVYDFERVAGQLSLRIQPGRYSVIFRPDQPKKSERTESVAFNLPAKGIKQIRF